MSHSMETILDKLVSSYQTPGPINSLSTCSLPNKRAVIEAFRHLQHIVFLGFFTNKDLRRDSLRLALGEHLLAAYDLLYKETRRAILWQLENHPEGELRKCGEEVSPIECADTWCENVLTSFFEQIPELREKLSEDVDAAYRNDPAATTVEDVVFSYPGIVAVTAYRIAHLLFKEHVPMIPRIITEYAHSKTGIDIHPGARIGRRFFIDHGTGVVIGATSVIGDDVVLYQGVTLGALHVDPNADPWAQRHPTLGDGVTVYAGTTILGGKTVIGDGATIGGNVWLLKSVPPKSRVYSVSSAYEVVPEKPEKKG